MSEKWYAAYDYALYGTKCIKNLAPTNKKPNGYYYNEFD